VIPDGTPTTMRLRDEVVEHLLGHVEVGDDAVLQGTNRDDVAGCAPEHRLCFVTDGEHGMIRLVDRDDRRLVEDDALAADVHERVRRAEVYREVVREHAGQQVVEHQRSMVSRLQAKNGAKGSTGRARPTQIRSPDATLGRSGALG
jgi:hypothetical protein